MPIENHPVLATESKRTGHETGTISSQQLPTSGRRLEQPAHSAEFGDRSSNMTEAEIQEKVISIVAEQMGVEKGEITIDTNFVNDLNADSLDTVELVMEFEDEFETSIPDEEAEKIQTVGQAIQFIKGSLASAD